MTSRKKNSPLIELSDISVSCNIVLFITGSLDPTRQKFQNQVPESVDGTIRNVLKRFKARCHHCFPKMWGLQILEKGVCTCVRSPPQPLHWPPAGISGCSPALYDSRWGQVKGGWGKKAGSQTTPDWWSLLEKKNHLNQHSFGTLVRLQFNCLLKHYLDFLWVTGTPCCDRLRWRVLWFSQNPREGSRERSPVTARGTEAPCCHCGKTSTLKQSCTHTEKESGFLATINTITIHEITFWCSSTYIL